MNMYAKYRPTLMQLTNHFGETSGPAMRIRDKAPAKSNIMSQVFKAYMATRYRPVGCNLSLG